MLTDTKANESATDNKVASERKEQIMSANKFTVEKLESKVNEAAHIVLGIPNFIIKASDEERKKLAAKHIWDKLGLLGVYRDAESHELLMVDCPEGEARRVFCETGGSPYLPAVRFRRVWAILTERTAPTTDVAYKELSSGFEKFSQGLKETLRTPGQMKDKELVEAYGPECEVSIIDELKRRSNDRPFVVFNNREDAVVDVETTLRMLREARRGRTMPVNYKVADSLKRLYRAGEFPAMFYFHCPFHKDTLLVDGFCDKSKQVWEGIDYECMQFARIALELEEITSRTPDIRQFIGLAVQGGLEGLRLNYPHVALVFDERKEVDSLPNLKVRMSDTSGRQYADPMNPNQKQRF